MNKNFALVFALTGMIFLSVAHVKADESVKAQSGFISRTLTSTKNCLLDNRVARFVKAHPYLMASGVGLSAIGYVVYKLWLAGQDEEEIVKVAPTRFNVRN